MRHFHLLLQRCSKIVVRANTNKGLNKMHYIIYIYMNLLWCTITLILIESFFFWCRKYAFSFLFSSPSLETSPSFWKESTYGFICKQKHNGMSWLHVPCILLPAVSSPVLLSFVFMARGDLHTAATHIGSTTAAATLTVSLTADNYLLLLPFLHLSVLIALTWAVLCLIVPRARGPAISTRFISPRSE